MQKVLNKGKEKKWEQKETEKGKREIFEIVYLTQVLIKVYTNQRCQNGFV